MAASISCAAEEGEPFVGYVHRSELFEYHVRDPGPLCPTLLDLLDEHARTIGGKIGVTGREHGPIRYYKFRDETDYARNAARCSPALEGCTVRDAVHSWKSLHAHELAHAYVYRVWGSTSTGLLNEGVAVALSCDPSFDVLPGQRPRDALSPRLSLLDWRAFLYLDGDTNFRYSAAGFFVTHLAERYGWSSVAELYRRVPPGISVADFEREFARVFPTSVDQAWAEALDTPGGAPCQEDWRCTATALAEGVQATPDCDDEMHRVINLNEPADIALTFDGKGSMKLVDCSASAAVAYSAEGVLGSPRVTHWTTLPAGSYAMLHGSSDLPNQVEWQRSDVAQNLVAHSCESGRVVALDPEGETVIDLPPNTAVGSEDTAWIRIAGGGQVFEMMPLDLLCDDEAEALKLCEGCSAAAACVPIRTGQWTGIAIGDEAVVRLQGVTASPPPARAQLVFATLLGDAAP